MKNFLSKTDYYVGKKIFLIFLLSFLVRISYITIAPARSLDLDDTKSWDSVGWNFLLGRGFLEIDNSPTHVRPPVYPIFLAMIYFLFGRNYTIVHIVQAVISSLVCVLIFFLAKKFFDEKSSFFAAICCGIWPAFVVYVGIIGTETLYSFLFILFIIVLCSAYANENQWYYLLSGIILGIANLTRSTVILYPVFLILFEYFFRKVKNMKRIVNVFLMFLVSMIVVSPWTIRNYKVFKRFLLVNTSAGELFWAGTYEPWDGIIKHNRDEYFRSLFNLDNPVDNERKMFREGLKNIKNNPIGFLKLTFKKFFRLWFKPIGQELMKQKSVILGNLMYIGQTILVLLFVVGLLDICNDVKFAPILTMVIYFTIMHNLITPLPRYRMPMEWLMVMFGSCGLLRMFEIFIASRRTGKDVLKNSQL